MRVHLTLICASIFLGNVNVGATACADANKVGAKCDLPAYCTVTSNAGNASPESLRACISQVNGYKNTHDAADIAQITINFDLISTARTITLTGALERLTVPVIIDGGTAGVTVDGNDKKAKCLQIQPLRRTTEGATFQIKKLSFTNCQADGLWIMSKAFFY
jgi:hypothetical protein